MRIAFVLTQDLESPSGLGRYFPLARQLVQRGHQVYISAIHPDFEALQARKFSQDGVEVSYVAPMHVSKRGNLKQYYKTFDLLGITLRATWNLSKDVLGYDAQIIHVGKPHPMNSIAGILGRLRSSVSLCVDCDDYEAGSMYFAAGWQKFIISGFERHVPKASKLVTVNTHFMHDTLLDWGVTKNKIVYLPNGVDIERYKHIDQIKVNEMRQSLGLAGKRVVAYLGSMSLPSHPVDLLLDAFTLILPHQSDTRLILVGGGGDYPALVEMVEKMGLSSSVVFTGRVSPRDVPLYYQLADVTVDPVYDNDASRGRSPLKLFESWASGVPFITSRVGDRITLLESSQSGILTDDCTTESYARAIISVLTTPQLADELRKNGEIEVQKYTWERLSGHLEEAYLQILTNNK